MLKKLLIFTVKIIRFCLGLLLLIVIGIPLAILMLIFPKIRRAVLRENKFLTKYFPNEIYYENNRGYLDLLQETLQLINENNGDPKVIYPYWQQHQQLLDQTFSQNLTNWYYSALSSADNQTKQGLAAILNELGILIHQFPLGNRRINLEIGIACYENSLEIRTREAFPEDWASTQNSLGEAYRNRIKGDKAENLERAIACYENSLEV